MYRGRGSPIWLLIFLGRQVIDAHLGEEAASHQLQTIAVRGLEVGQRIEVFDFATSRLADVKVREKDDKEAVLEFLDGSEDKERISLDSAIRIRHEDAGVKAAALPSRTSHHDSVVEALRAGNQLVLVSALQVGDKCKVLTQMDGQKKWEDAFLRRVEADGEGRKYFMEFNDGESMEIPHRNRVAIPRATNQETHGSLLQMQANQDVMQEKNGQDEVPPWKEFAELKAKQVDVLERIGELKALLGHGPSVPSTGNVED